MEAFFLKLFDWKKPPIYIVFVVFIVSTILLLSPENVIAKLKLNNFNNKYGIFIGFAFIVSIAFLMVSLVSFIILLFKKKRDSKKIKKEIISSLQSLTYHEMYLILYFLQNGKSTKNLPIFDETVNSLEIKNIIYKSSDFGPVKASGAFWSYTIAKEAVPYLEAAIEPLKKLDDYAIENLRQNVGNWQY